MTSSEPVRFDTWLGALWTAVIALDFFWLSNPVVLSPFDDSLHRACVATLIAVLATLPWIQVPRPSWAVLAVLTFGFTSMLWSTEADLTADFTFTYLVIAIIATVLAANADARTVAQGMLFGGVLILAASMYAMHEKLPRSDVPLGTIGYLAGVGANRNILAYTMLISLAAAVGFLPRRWWGRLVWALATAYVAVGLYLAQSGTGYIAALIVVGSAVALGVSDHRQPRPVRSARRRWAARGVAVAVLLAGVLGAEFISRLLGRDATLSGRVPLWEAIWSSTTGVDRWFGVGWGSVWPHPWNPAPPNPAYLAITEASGAPLAHGHNAILDLIPEIGVFGAVVFSLTYVHAVMRALRLRTRRPLTPRSLEASRVALLLVLGLLLFGLTEPMSTIPLGWFSIVLLASGLVPVARRARRRERVAGKAGGAPQQPPDRPVVVG